MTNKYEDEMLKVGRQLSKGSKHKLLFMDYMEAMAPKEARVWHAMMNESHGEFARFLDWLDEQEKQDD